MLKFREAYPKRGTYKSTTCSQENSSITASTRVKQAGS